MADLAAIGFTATTKKTEPSAPPVNWSEIGDDDDSLLPPQHPSHESSAAEGDYGAPLDDDDAGEEGDGEDKPLEPHACRYCGFQQSIGVAKCNTCKKWFCNNRGCTTASHLVTHLVRSKHKEVVLHADSPLGDMLLECYVCGSKNVFLLGFIPSKEESVVVLLCREPCLHSPILRDMNWDASSWLPIIEERQMLSWLVTIPEKQSRHLRGVKSITGKQMGALEEQWKSNPEAKLEDLMREEANRLELPMVPAVFVDGAHYNDVFVPLILAEAQHQRQMKESMTHDSVSVRWSVAVTGKTLATFEIPLSEANVATGDELRLIHSGANWEGKLIIVSLEDTPTTTGEVVAELRSAAQNGRPIALENQPIETLGYTIRFVYKSITFDRMLVAMKTMSSDEKSVSAFLYYKLLGQPMDEPVMQGIVLPRNINAPNIAELNHSQATAVRSVLRRPLSLIQGPPGTGKTVTSATIIYHMRQMNNAQVLVCAPSNVAVDQLAERLQKTGLNVVRVSSRTREATSSSIDELMLHVQVKQFCDASPERSEVRKLLRLRDEIGHLNDKDKRRLTVLLQKIEESIISNADVICTTCSVAGDRRLEKFRFKHVLIDESTQSAEPECLIPIVMGCKQLVLVGDHCQMGPVILHRPAERAGLGRSLFERLVELGEHPIRLDVQYRMHPCLSEFSSNAFYEGTLQNGVTAEQRDASTIFSWPDPNQPMFFYNSISPEEIAASGTSYLNRNEAALSEKFVTSFMRAGAMPDQIGVITPYEGQRCYLINYCARNGPLLADAYKRVEVASVDSFQGREKEFIILTCVRSNDHQGIGFLDDWRRLNVALTRARRGLIIIGNARVLSRHALWHSLLSHFKERNLIVDGPVSGLKTLDVTLQKPRVVPGQVIGPTTLGGASRHGARGGSGAGGYPLPGSPGMMAPYHHSSAAAAVMGAQPSITVGGVPAGMAPMNRRQMYQMDPSVMPFGAMPWGLIPGMPLPPEMAAAAYVPGSRAIGRAGGHSSSQATGPISQASLSVGSGYTQDDD